MRDLIFVDTETTGLSESEDQLIELTWARISGDPKTLYFGVTEVPDFIDGLIKFTERGIAGRVSPWSDVEEFLNASDGQTMVAANPTFDAGFLKTNGLFRFHYRMLDVETFAYAMITEFDDMPSMKNIYDYLVSKGVVLTEPDHTSYNDVLAMREAYRYLEAL